MAVGNKVLIPGKFAEIITVGQYTAPDATTTIIDKFSVVNTSTVNVKFSAYIVGVSKSASDENIVIDDKTIGIGETYLCPELVGRTLDSGGFISTLAGAASALSIMASGREITATTT